MDEKYLWEKLKTEEQLKIQATLRKAARIRKFARTVFKVMHWLVLATSVAALAQFLKLTTRL